jgi:hypothetical protein
LFLIKYAWICKKQTRGRFISARIRKSLTAKSGETGFAGEFCPGKRKLDSRPEEPGEVSVNRKCQP